MQKIHTYGAENPWDICHRGPLPLGGMPVRAPGSQTRCRVVLTGHREESSSLVGKLTLFGEGWGPHRLLRWRSGKEPTCKRGARSLGQEDPLEKEMAAHSSILAWEIPWTDEPGRLQSMRSPRVGHNWANT